MSVVDVEAAARETENAVLEVAPQPHFREKFRAGPEGRAPEASVFGFGDLREEELDALRPLGHAAEIDREAAVRRRHPHRAERRLDLPRTRRQERRQRESHVAQYRARVRLDGEPRMVEVLDHAADDLSAPESERPEHRVEGRHAREAGAARAGLQVLAPEERGPARLVRGVERLAVAQDLRRGLEGDARVESDEEALEKARARRRAREIQSLEDVVERERLELGLSQEARQPFFVSRATRARMRDWASSENQKVAKGSPPRA